MTYREACELHVVRIPLLGSELSKCGSMTSGGDFMEGRGGCWRCMPANPVPGKLEQGSLAQVRRQACKSL